MKRLLLTLMAGSLTLAALLLPTGCSDEKEEEGTTDPGPCGITALTPEADQVFYAGDPENPDVPGDIIGIRWEKSGSESNVSLDLLKGGEFLGSITESTPNAYPYYFPWYAETMGQVSGGDYSVLITALGATDCADTTDEFSILNTAGCSILMVNPPENGGGIVWNEGDEVQITWDSEFTTNLLDIELWIGEELAGVIDELVADSGLYTWTVDSFHQGTSDEFSITIKDSNVDGCSATSGQFTINDENLCNIGIIAPQEDDVWEAGTTETIIFFGELTTGTVDIILQEGNEFLGYISQAPVDVATGEFDWFVAVIGNPQTFTNFKIKIVDAEDEYCYSVSERFTIEE